MSWYKVSQELQNFNDRNILNNKIIRLEKISNTLLYTAKLIYQTQRGARKIVSSIITDKTLSSFPEIINNLKEAEKIALDSPVKFADYCKIASEHINKRINKFIKDRKSFMKDTIIEDFKSYRK